MNLTQYIESQRGNAKSLAEALGVSMSYLSQMAGGAAINPRRAVEIEQATAGSVTRRDLRPEDWHRIWPELVTSDFPAPIEKAPADHRAAA